MTREQFEKDVLEYLDIVNRKKNDPEGAKQDAELLKDRVRLPYMGSLVDTCFDLFGDDPEHNRQMIFEFIKIFEHCFNPPQMELDDFNFHDPWLRAFQAKYLAFYEKYYLSDQNLVQALIDIVCRRNYQIWHMRKEQKKVNG